MLDAMFEKKVSPDEHVIDQGDDGDNFYVVDRLATQNLFKENIVRNCHQDLIIAYTFSGTYDIFVKIDGADKNVSINKLGNSKLFKLCCKYCIQSLCTIHCNYTNVVVIDSLQNYKFHIFVIPCSDFSNNFVNML